MRLGLMPASGQGQQREPPIIRLAGVCLTSIGVGPPHMLRKATPIMNSPDGFGACGHSLDWSPVAPLREVSERTCMGQDQLHVVFGTGQVGQALVTHLATLGVAVRAVSRHRPAGLAGPGTNADWRPVDATDPEAAADAAKGASVVYQCLNAPYSAWPERFPPLQRGVLSAAERNGALLVSLENIYGYGSTGGKPMTEDLPLAATTVKGRTRAAMTQELLAAADAGRVRIGEQLLGH